MIGDSDFTYWMHMQRDMMPYRIYPAGFGGSITSSVLDHADEIVIKYAPRTIVYNCGNNDVMFGLTVEQNIQNFKEFVTKVRTALPDIRIIKTSLLFYPYGDYAKPKLREEMLQVDKLIKDFIKEDQVSKVPVEFL